MNSALLYQFMLKCGIVRVQESHTPAMQVKPDREHWILTKNAGNVFHESFIHHPYFVFALSTDREHSQNNPIKTHN